MVPKEATQEGESTAASVSLAPSDSAATNTPRGDAVQAALEPSEPAADGAAAAAADPQEEGHLPSPPAQLTKQVLGGSRTAQGAFGSEVKWGVVPVLVPLEANVLLGKDTGVLLPKQIFLQHEKDYRGAFHCGDDNGEEEPVILQDVDVRPTPGLSCSALCRACEKQPQVEEPQAPEQPQPGLRPVLILGLAYDPPFTHRDRFRPMHEASNTLLGASTTAQGVGELKL